jgi:uncharacterized protein (TIGR03067 family)
MRFSVPLLFVPGLMSLCGCGHPADPIGPADGNKPVRNEKAIAEEQRELELLKGTWTVTNIVAAGKPVPTDRVKNIHLQYVFDGNNITIHRLERPDKKTPFTVDGSATPKKLTITGDPLTKAAYSVNGNSLKLCVMVDENRDAGHPTALASTASPKTDLLTLERR